MGNFEKLSVLVIVVIIVMILVVALYTWSDNPDPASSGTTVATKSADLPKLEQPGGAVIRIPQIPPTPLAEKPALVTTGPTTGPTPGSLLLPSIGGPQTPAVTPAPAPEVKAEPTVHEIVAGDTLGKLAKQNKVTVAMIEDANPGVDAMRLRPGMKLTIPAPKTTTEAAKREGKSDGNRTTIVVKENAPSVRPGTVYTFVRGDTLPSLSKRAYGTADRWHEIWIANYAAIDNPDVVPPGTRVKLPAK